MSQMSSAKNWQYLTAFIVEAKDNFLGNVLICTHMAYFFPRCIYFFSKRLFLVNGEVKQIFEIFKLISNIAVNSSAMDCKVPQWPGLIRGAIHNLLFIRQQKKKALYCIEKRLAGIIKTLIQNIDFFKVWKTNFSGPNPT